MTPSEAIDRNLPGMVNPNARYHHPLPPELAKWYCYTLDGGHSILVLIKHWHRKGMTIGEAVDYMVPAPVKTVMRGYSVDGDLIVIDVPYVGQSSDDDRIPPYYSSRLGLVCSGEDSESQRPISSPLSGQGIAVDNDGAAITHSNYWDSEMAARGLIYLTPNDGTIRLLLPEGVDISDWVRGCRHVVYSRGPIDPQSGQRMTELLFEDGSSNPFLLVFGSQSWMSLPADPGPRRSWQIAIWTRRNGRPVKVWESTCFWRTAPRIPFARPFRR